MYIVKQQGNGFIMNLCCSRMVEPTLLGSTRSEGEAAEQNSWRRTYPEASQTANEEMNSPVASTSLQPSDTEPHYVDDSSPDNDVGYDFDERRSDLLGSPPPLQADLSDCYGAGVPATTTAESSDDFGPFLSTSGV